MKTFSQFQEAAFAPAIPAAAGFITKFGLPAAAAIVGGVGTYMQSKKDSPKGPFADTPSAEELRKAKLTGKLIKPREGDAKKERELISKAEKEITKPKKGEKKDALKTLKDFLKARKIEGRTAMKLKQDNELMTKGPGDQLPGARRDYLNKLLKNLRKKDLKIEEVMAAPTNNVGGGKIAGTVEAGDDPPVKKKKDKKKKRYIYGGRGSRKMWMSNK